MTGLDQGTELQKVIVDFCRLLWAGAGPMSLVLLKHEHELVFGNLMLCPTRRGIDRQCLVTKRAKR
jgi:hypothetical protein